MFDEAVPSEIHKMIDKLIDCDDLTFNIMVGDYLERLGMPQTPALLIGKVNVQKIASQASKLEYLHSMLLKSNVLFKVTGYRRGRGFKCGFYYPSLAYYCHYGPETYSHV